MLFTFNVMCATMRALVVSTISTKLRRNPGLCMRLAADRIVHNISTSTETKKNTAGVDEDPCLRWARANREIAQACLNPPPDRADGDSSQFWRNIEEGRSTWEDYWDWRQWDFSACRNSEQSLRHGQSLSTRALTTPLTAFNSLCHSIRWNAQDDALDLDPGTPMPTGPILDRNHLWWCCLGARSEASLPIEYWKELIGLICHYDRSRLPKYQCHGGSPIHLHIDFCGPEMDARRPDVCISTSSKATLTLRWVYQGKYHDYYHSQAAGDGPIDYDAYLLFNPGVGHPYLRDDWLPTLDLLFDNNTNRARKRSTVLLTAHSEYDASRDAAALYSNTNIQVNYTENPFSAQLEYQDPLLDGHRVRPNHYVGVVSKENVTARQCLGG